MNFGLLYNKSVFASGGVGNEAYTDDVVQWGFNLSETVAVPGVPGKAQASYAIENKFFAASPNKYGSECHMSLVDTLGVNHRVTSYWLPHDGGTGSGMNEAVDYINWTNWAGTQRVQWHLLNKQASFSDSFVLQFIVNNVPVLKQFNAAGNALLNLPYFNADNRMALSGPFAAVGGAPPTTGSYLNIFGVIDCTALPAGGTILYVKGPNVTGAYTMLDLQGSPTTNLQATLNNQRTSNPAAHAYWTISTTASGGDPMLDLNCGAGIFWRSGLDNSDGGKWKWAYQANLGAGGDKMILDLNGNLVITGALTTAGQAVTFGAADSAGAGFRTMRVGN